MDEDMINQGHVDLPDIGLSKARSVTTFASVSMRRRHWICLEAGTTKGHSQKRIFEMSQSYHSPEISAK